MAKTKSNTSDEGRDFLHSADQVAGDKIPKLICPFHGLVNAVNEDEDGFHCVVPSCNITRTGKELE